MDNEKLRYHLEAALALLDEKAPAVETPKDTVVEVAPPQEKVIPTTDPYAYFRPLLNLIGKAEGTDKGRGYNETLSYGAFTNGDVNLTAMTLEEIIGLQGKMLAHKSNTLNSSALGRYQIVRKTLRALIEQMALKPDMKFDQALQDDLAVQLLVNRKVGSWLNGNLTTTAFMTGLAAEWASFPIMNGKSYYGGKARITATEVQASLAQVRSLWQAHKK